MKIVIQSIEDRELKEKIDHYCEQLLANEEKALGELTEIVKSSTKTMTSVPRPFKFLKTHYQALREHYASLPDSQYKVVHSLPRKNMLTSCRPCP